MVDVKYTHTVNRNMGIKKKKYTLQFKKEVVRLSFEAKSIKDLALKLDLTVQNIYEWRKLFIDNITSNEGLNNQLSENSYLTSVTFNKSLNKKTF